jgi:ketosteroid isomerase-like protein
MSQENVEIVRRWNTAYNRRDFENLIELTDPDLEFRSIFVGIESVFRGMTVCVPTSMESTARTPDSRFRPRGSSTPGRPFS